MRSHRPFWVLRHRVFGIVKTSSYPDLEDSMWEVLLTDGSSAAKGDQLLEEIAKAKQVGRSKEEGMTEGHEKMPANAP